MPALVKAQQDPAEQFLADHPTFQKRSSRDSAWVQDLRSRGAQEFRRLGIPTARQEDWKYTDLGRLAQTPFSSPAGAKGSIDAAPPTYPGLSGPQLVFVDGRFDPNASSTQDAPKGLRAGSLRAAISDGDLKPEEGPGRLADVEGNAFVALNTAWLEDGAVVAVADGTILRQPLHILFLTTAAGRAVHPRVLVRLGKNAQLTLVQTYAGPTKGAHLTNAVTEIHAGEASVLHHTTVQIQNESSSYLHTVELAQHRASNAALLDLTVGGGLARNDVNQRFLAEGGECTLDGLYVLRGDQHADNHTRIDHAVPRCTSRQFYKGILDEKARGVFYGKVLVRKGALKTNATQQNKNLLLSTTALADSIPALEILADDVKCGHGSSIGQLSQDSLFYLRARGLDETTARSLLTYAFARDIVDRIKVEPVRAKLDDILLSRLPNGRAVREALHESQA